MKQKLRVFLTLLLCAVASVGWGEKITDYNNIVSGKKYYIGATTGSTDYYLSVDGGSLSTSIAGTAVTSKTDATAFTFAGSETSWSIQFENGYYLSLKNSRDNGKVQVVENSSIFTASNQSSKIRLSIGDYSIQKNNSGTQFGSYGNTQTDVWLEEVPNVAPTTYTVTFNAGDGTFVGNTDFPNESNTQEAGTYTLPSATPATGYTFDGWLATGSTTPVTGSYTVSGDVDFIAQYTQSGSDEENMVTDRITESDFEKNNSYIDFTINDKPSGVIYKGNAANPSTKSYLQFRSSNNSGLVVTNSSCKVHTIRIQWNTYTTSGRTVDIYGSDTPYTATSNLYTSSTQGTKLGSLSYDGNTNTTSLEVTGDYSYIGVRSNSGAIYLNYIEIIWEKQGGAPSPSISADNVEIAYSAEDGVINYSITNAVEGGELTASTTATWLTLGDVETNSVPFTCSANETTEPRTATITLSYTYGENETVTKNVTVTQAAAPVIYTTIPALFAAATSAETDVTITFGNWVVSGVSTNGKNIFVTDNNGNGFVIYYGSDMSSTFSAGNILSGTVSCKLKKFNGFAELVNLDANGLTITTGGSVTTFNIAMADLAGVNTGALVSYENLTCSVDNNKYYLTDGTTTIQVYNSLYAFNALEAGKTYNITGVYQQYNNTKEILPRSADDIVKVEVPSITVASTEIEVVAAGAEETINVTYNNITNVEAEVQFVGADGTTVATYDWIEAEVNDENNISYIVNENTSTEARIAYLKVYALDDNANDVYSELITITQAAAATPGTGDSYELFSGELVEGDYIIYYDGKAMNTTVTSDRLQYEEVSPTGNVIATENAAIVWHIAKSGDYWTIYNAEANAYAAGTGAKNKAQMLTDGTDDKALWTVSGTETYEFVNKQNTANSVNANLRNNGTFGFACYATGTGGALSLYKKVTDTPETESVTVGSAGYTTYVTKKNVAIPEGVEVYIVTAINESSIHMEPVTGAIPANTPIVVKASADTYELTATDGETADVSDNLLLGSDGTIKGDGSTIYALGVGKEGDAQGKVGFYRVKSGATVPAGKAYLDTSVVAKDFLNFDFGETDGIGQIEIGQTSNVGIYNLNGQKVNKAQKGIYIVNGKKIVIR